jgi:hypothetical protein
MQSTEMSSLTFAGDESGDASFSYRKGASTYFVVSMIAARDHILQNLLRELRLQSGLPAAYEFSFHGLTSAALRTRVFSALMETEFEAWAVVVNKHQLSDAFRVMRPLELYLYFVSEVIQLIPEEKRLGATLLMDEFGSPTQMPSELRRVLKARAIPRCFKRITAKRSKSEPLIQVADLVAGALSRHLAQRDSDAYRTIEGKMQKIAEFREA